MKYKYFLHHISTPRDFYGNVYNCAVITDAKSGKQLKILDAPISNLLGAFYYINGQQHIQNYLYVSACKPKREFKQFTRNFKYIGCSPEEISHEFFKLLKSRKKVS